MYFLPFTPLHRSCQLGCREEALLRSATMDHNGPLFWLHVAERSLVSHVSSAVNVPSCHFHTSAESLQSPSSPLAGFNLHAEIIFTAHQGWPLRRKQAFPCVNIWGRLGQVCVSSLTHFFLIRVIVCCFSIFSLAAFKSACHNSEE